MRARHQQLTMTTTQLWSLAAVWGMRVEKPSSVAFVFQVFWTIQGKTKARDFCYFSSEARERNGEKRYPAWGVAAALAAGFVGSRPLSHGRGLARRAAAAATAAGTVGLMSCHL